MTDSTNVVSDDTNPVSDQNVNVEAESETVTVGAYRKLVGQRKSDQVKLQEARAKIAEFEANEKARADQKLVDDNKWKELYEAANGELDAERSKNKSIVETVIRADKLNAFQESLGGELAHKKFVKHIELDEITLNEDGSIDQDSVKAEVDRFRAEFGETLLKTKPVASMGDNAPAAAQPKTAAQLSTAERAALRRSLVTKK